MSFFVHIPQVSVFKLGPFSHKRKASVYRYNTENWRFLLNNCLHSYTLASTTPLLVHKWPNTLRTIQILCFLLFVHKDPNSKNCSGLVTHSKNSSCVQTTDLSRTQANRFCPAQCLTDSRIPHETYDECAPIAQWTRHSTTRNTTHLPTRWYHVAP